RQTRHHGGYLVGEPRTVVTEQVAEGEDGQACPCGGRVGRCARRTGAGPEDADGPVQRAGGLVHGHRGDPAALVPTRQRLGPAPGRLLGPPGLLLVLGGEGGAAAAIVAEHVDGRRGDAVLPLAPVGDELLVPGLLVLLHLVEDQRGATGLAGEIA